MELRFYHRNGLLICFVVVLFSTLSFGQSNLVLGWTIQKLSGSKLPVQTCVATWKDSNPAELSINALGPLLQLVISSSKFPQKQAEETIGLEKKNMPRLTRTATVAESSYGITIDKDVDAYLIGEGAVVVTTKSKQYLFDLINVPSAIDALRRCVGQPTRSEMQSSTKPAFKLPDGWEAIKIGEGCAARLEGDEVNTTIAINNSDKVLLIAGRRDWNSWGGQIDLTLQFDSDPPRSFRASRWNNLVLLLLLDDEDVSALRKSSKLQWHLPNGDFATRVHDVGSAIDAVRACTNHNKTEMAH